MIGQSQARVQLPPWPTECRRDTPHAAVKIGDEMISAWKRERGQVDAANAQKDRCAVHYDSLAARLAANGN